MQVRLLVSREGPNLSQQRGQVIEVGDEEGLRMVAAAQAEFVIRPTAAPEKAAKRGRAAEQAAD